MNQITVVVVVPVGRIGKYHVHGIYLRGDLPTIPVVQRYRVVLEDFSRLWEVATEKERKGLLRCIFSRIMLDNGEIVEYKAREPFRSLLPDVVSGAGGQIEHLPEQLAQAAPAGKGLDAA